MSDPCPVFLRSVMIAALALVQPCVAQEQATVHLKHRVFALWGYNRAQYSVSNIHFNGPGYDFNLHDVVADDAPYAFSVKRYFDPATIWVAQYNYRAGWFLNDRWSFSLGLDHMKYVVRADQTVRLTGDISPQRSTAYAGAEEHPVKLTADFLTYEHTDGLNLLSIDADHYDPLWKSMNGKHVIFLLEGVGVGPVIPRSDVRLFGEGLNNRFHLAGYGATAQVGVFAVGWDRFFLRAAVRGGYIELPDVLTTGTSVDRARQRFWFVEEYAALGVLIGK